MDEIALHDRALDEVARLVAGVRPDQLDRPTPCTDWTVRTLIAHLIDANRRFTHVAEGQPVTRPDRPPDLGAEDYTDSYRESAKALAEAWKVPGRLDQLFRLPFGELPGRAALGMRLVELTGHGWDLARATGQQPEFDQELVAAATRFAQRSLPPGQRSGTPFAPASEAPADASALDHLAAFLGRAV